MSVVKDVNINGRTVADSKDLLGYLTDANKTGNGKYVCGLGFITDNYLDEFQAVKIANQKTSGRQFRQITISPSLAGNNLSNEDFLELGRTIGMHYYNMGFQVIICLHTDTDTRHLHLMLNSVNFRTGKMFTQPKSGLNRFKVCCDNAFLAVGLDPIGKPVDAIMDSVIHEMTDGFDCLELFDEIMADKASALSDLYTEPVAERQPLYTPEYTRGDRIVCAPTKALHSFNPDAPKPWARIEIHPDGSWGIPTRPLDSLARHIISFMRPEEQQKILSFSPQKQYYKHSQISGKDFVTQPTYYLDAHTEYNIVVDSDAELEQVLAVLHKFSLMQLSNNAYYAKLGIAAVAQLNRFGIDANIMTDASTIFNITFKGKDDDPSE